MHATADHGTTAGRRRLGWAFQSPLSDVLYSKIEVGGQFSYPIPGGSGREYAFPYADIGIGVKL